MTNLSDAGRSVSTTLRKLDCAPSKTKEINKTNLDENNEANKVMETKGPAARHISMRRRGQTNLRRRNDSSVISQESHAG